MNKIRTLGFLAITALVTAGLGGCAGGPPTGSIPIDIGESFEAQTPWAIDVQNHRGSVFLTVNPDATGPSVIALDRTGSVSTPDVRWTAASAAMDNDRPVLRVLSTPQDSDDQTWVELRIVVPSCGGVRVVNDGGAVTLRGVSGAIEVQNSLTANEGEAIRVETAQTLSAPVLLQSERGSIQLRMGHTSMGHLTVSAPNGRVTVDGAYAKVRQVQAQRGAWSGVINGGENDLRINAQNGDVIVRVGLGEFETP